MGLYFFRVSGGGLQMVVNKGNCAGNVLGIAAVLSGEDEQQTLNLIRRPIAFAHFEVQSSLLVEKRERDQFAEMNLYDEVGEVDYVD